MDKTCRIVFCPRKTGSSSISRTWSNVKNGTSFHTHDMKYFVVTDKSGSDYLKHLKSTCPSLISFENVLDTDTDSIEYTLILKNLDANIIFNWFDNFELVTSLRNPLDRRVSELMQSLTVDQINAVMDTFNSPSCGHLDISRKPRVNTLIETYTQICSESKCLILNDALSMIKSSRRLLSVAEVCNIFEKHFVRTDTAEFTFMFTQMERFMCPDFDLERLNEDKFVYQNYNLFGKRAKHIMFKIEDMKTEKLLSEFYDMTGIEELSREHDHQSCHHLFGIPARDMKRTLVERFRDSLLSKRESLEYKIVDLMGYH